jgi:hypothetical protein
MTSVATCAAPRGMEAGGTGPISAA